MGIDYSARLFGIVFSDIRLEFLERMGLVERATW